MNPTHRLIADRLETVRDRLIDVGALLETTPEARIAEVVAEMDLKLRDAQQAAEACQRLTILYRAPRHASYDPAETLRAIAAHEPDLADLEIAPGALRAVRMCEGDAEQVRACAWVVMHNVRLESGGRLQITVSADNGDPRVVLALSGPGALPERFDLGADHVVTIDEFGQRWIAATNGGHMAIANDAIMLYLEGDRATPPSSPGLEQAQAAMTSMARRLRPWRCAIGHYEPGFLGDAELIRLYHDAVAGALRDIDQALEPAPAGD